MGDTRKLYHLLSNASVQGTNPFEKDHRTLCQTLFDQLHSTFHQFLSALPHHDHPSGSLPPPHSQLWPVIKDLSLILRCCLLLLTLPLDQKFLFLKCRYVLRILKSFLSLHATESHGLRFRNFLSDVELDLSDSCRPFLCALLEVFADELLRHQSLRRHLMIADSTSSICEKLFVSNFVRGDIANVLEVMSSHFILSFSYEKAFEDFISRLFIPCDKDFRFPELSLAPSIVLLLDPIVLSAPKMFQVHLISMVSEAIGSGLSSEILAPDMVDCHLIAFQKSVILYSMHVSSLQIDGFCDELKCAHDSYQCGRGHPTFESYIQQGTRNILNQVLSKSDNSWDSYQCKMSCKTKPDVLAECIAFMKEKEYIFVDSSRDVITSFLDCIIHRAFSQDAIGDALYNIKENTSAQDVCLLALILKLMSTSLLQAIKYLSKSGDSSCLKTMGSASVREKYDFLISIVDHFQQLKFCLPIQTFLYDVMTSQQSNYKVSKSMLVHFTGLLSLSFSNGLDLLAKGCISIIMALMHLFIFEEGDLVALGSLRGLSLRSCLSGIPSDKSGEGDGDKRSAYEVAAEFHRIRACNLRKDSNTSYNSVEDGTEETCNGEPFLNCILVSKKLSDYDELADFLECNPGKNYSKWLNGREVYRKWRHQKRTDLRKTRRKKSGGLLSVRKLVCL